MKKLMIILLLILFILSGCTGNESNEEHVEGLNPQMIEVHLSAEPEQMMPQERVEVLAKVTLDGKDVNNADEVVFEFWKDGHSDQSEKIDGDFIGEGVYSTTKTFADKGVYYVVSHVTLREMHNMPRIKLVVGDVPGEEMNHEQVEHDQEMEHD